MAGASSGQVIRHRLSRAGHRKLNHAPYMMAMVQVRRPSAGQAYYRRKLAEGKSPKEALRCLKRRLSDAVYRCLRADQHRQPSPVGLA
jgi:transposase